MFSKLMLIRNFSNASILCNNNRNNLHKLPQFATATLTSSFASLSTDAKLIYLQNPFTWFRNKFYLQVLRHSWDKDFRETEFKRGAVQATVLITRLVRDGQVEKLQHFTTVNGYRQIANDISVSRNDPRLKMLLLRPQDIRRSIPVKVYFMIGDNGRRHCFIDMFMVGVRRLNGLSDADRLQFNEYLKEYYGRDNAAEHDETILKKILFTEMYVRFHKEYLTANENDWNISYYKVATFNILSIK